MTEEFPPGRPWFIRQGYRAPKPGSHGYDLQTRFNHHLLAMRQYMTVEVIAEVYEISESAVRSRAAHAGRQRKIPGFRVPAEPQTVEESELVQLRAEVVRLRQIIKSAADAARGME